MGNIKLVINTCTRSRIIPSCFPRLLGTFLQRIILLLHGILCARVPLRDCLNILKKWMYELIGMFDHPFNDPWLMACNGTIGLEISEDLPNVDTVNI